MGVTEWSELCTKVKEIEADYCKSDHMVDMMTEIFIIHVEDDVSDEIMMKAQAAGVSDDDEMTTPNTNTASSSGIEDGLDSQINMIDGAAVGMSNGWTDWDEIFYVYSNGSLDDFKTQLDPVCSAAVGISLKAFPGRTTSAGTASAARDISTCLFPPYHMQKQMTQSHVLGGCIPVVYSHQATIPIA
ncbi:hypothetical protein EVAR_90837_1 [Eumeta japonica]|uniref:Uncharacterized protein n=1 Tax=Eumeta variegata TaxID=151549 RepID=A0A4C2AEE6_EUMVA|nr:hypothetical protein EVAR_90837_1 [Eumeta japonica]